MGADAFVIQHPYISLSSFPQIILLNRGIVMSKKKYLVCRNNAISNRRMKLIKRNIQMFICMTRYLFFRNINPCTEQTHVQTIFTSHTVQHVVPKTKRQCTIKTSVHDNLFGIKKTIFLSNILNQGMKKLTRK